MKQEDKSKKSNATEQALQDRRITETKENVQAAREEAYDDIEHDADLSIHSPNDDLDEGETARLGEDKTDLV